MILVIWSQKLENLGWNNEVVEVQSFLLKGMSQCCGHILSAFNIQISVWLWTHLWIKSVFGVISLESDQLYAFVEILTMQEGAFW